MRFAHPQYLWLLAALPVAYWALRAEIRSREKRFEEFAGRKVWERIAPEADFGRRVRKLRVWSLAAALILLSLARPQWGVHEEVFKVAGLDLVFALDVSNSMLVEDVVPSRLKKARHAVRSIVDALKGDRVGIVAFAGSAYVACPLTTDLGYVLETLDTLGPEMVANQGTDVGIGLETAARALERGAEDPSRDLSEDAAPTKVVVLVSDGEDLEEKGLSAVRALTQAGARLYVLGVGTADGAPIPLRDENGGLRGYKNGPDGKPVVSRFRPDDLMRIASEAGGKYWALSEGEEEVDELLREIGALDRTDYAERKVVFHEDRYQIPLALGVLLLLIELSMSVRRLRRASAALVAAIAAAASGSEAFAAPGIGTYLDNRRGMDAYEEKKIEEAKKWFGDAQARDPTSPELMYNQGVIQAEEKDVQNSVRGFAGAAKGAIERKDPALGAKSFYNLGSALEKSGDAPGAVQSFLRSIDQARAAKDETLENDARKRLERLVQQQKQQQQQQQQQQQEQQEQQQQQSGQGEQEQQQDKSGEDQQPKQYQETPKDKRDNPFKSKKLTKEDADRVMAELMNRDRQLQMKLKKQKGEGAGGQREW